MTSFRAPNGERANEGRLPQNQNDVVEFQPLDGTTTEHSSPNTQSPIKMRRESFTENTPAFSPSEGPWSGFHFSIENSGLETSATSQNFFAPQHNPTITTQQNGLVASQTHWGNSRPSGSCTPTPGFEQTTEFGSQRQPNFGQQQIQSSQQSGYEQVHGSTPQNYPLPGFTTSPSTRTGGGWISASPPDAMDFRTVPSSTNPSSPVLSGGSSQVLRRDGIRKKNARFEIPAERNLRTIDHLINSTTDEQEVKELKAQKRLLRNRQAALDSRQRKKQHTERLEEEKKHYTTMINELEDAVNDMRLQRSEWVREKENLTALHQQYQQYIESVTMEKEELIRRHTIETGDLRKKNGVLMEQLQRMDSTAMSTAPSSNGFSADFSDFDHLNMNSWDDFSMPHDFSIEVEPRPALPTTAQPKQETMPQETSNHLFAEEKAMPSGFLLMLLLCGAWVASRGSDTAPEPLPSFPDDIRSASVTMLDNIYKDSGVAMASMAQTLQAAPSTDVDEFQTSKSNFPSYGFAEGARPTMEAAHQSLIAPSEQQAREQAFSLTPDQYNDLGSSDTNSRGENIMHAHRNPRTLGDILSSTSSSTERVAETYTHSLLKDKVSTQVLQDFARMISQSNLYGQNQWKAEPLD